MDNVVYVIYLRFKVALDARSKKSFSEPDIQAFRRSLHHSPVDISALRGCDPSRMPCLTRFDVVKRSSNCLFAKQSKLWASTDWNYEKTIEENVEENMVALQVFTEAGKGLHLDGFLFEARFA
jgi:hypothetical protein